MAGLTAVRVVSAEASSDQVIASFGRSIPKMIGLLALGVLMTGLGVAIALGYVGPADFYKIAVGWFAALFFGLCTLAILAQTFRAGPVVVVTRDGIRYHRRAKELIRWQEVSAISVQAIKRQRFVVLKLRDSGWTGDSDYVRAVDATNQAFGFHGVWISMTGLDGSIDDLLDAIAKTPGATALRAM